MYISFVPLECSIIYYCLFPSSPGELDWAYICRASSKVITFIDLAGHEKYLKTTIFGMTGHAPDFCMLMVRKSIVQTTTLEQTTHTCR